MELQEFFETVHFIFRLAEDRANFYEKPQDAILKGDKNELVEKLSEYLENWNVRRHYKKEKLKDIIKEVVELLEKEGLLKESKDFILGGYKK